MDPEIALAIKTAVGEAEQRYREALEKAVAASNAALKEAVTELRSEIHKTSVHNNWLVGVATVVLLVLGAFGVSQFIGLAIKSKLEEIGLTALRRAAEEDAAVIGIARTNAVKAVEWMNGAEGIRAAEDAVDRAASNKLQTITVTVGRNAETLNTVVDCVHYLYSDQTAAGDGYNPRKSPDFNTWSTAIKNITLKR